MNIKENIIAIPSKGKFCDESLRLLIDSGIVVSLTGRQLVAGDLTLPAIGNFQLSLLRPVDTVSLVASNQISLGIVGMDTLKEYESERNRNDTYQNRVKILLKLGIGRCRLVIAALESSGLKSVQELEAENEDRSGWFWPEKAALDQLKNKVVATSLMRATRHYIADMEVGKDTYEDFGIKLKKVTGSVEAYPGMGKADAIADLVDTGDTLRENGLKELITIDSFEGVLIANNSYRRGSNRFMDGMRDRIFATLYRRENPNATKRQRVYDKYIYARR